MKRQEFFSKTNRYLLLRAKNRIYNSYTSIHGINKHTRSKIKILCFMCNFFKNPLCFVKSRVFA